MIVKFWYTVTNPHHVDTTVGDKLVKALSQDRVKLTWGGTIFF